MLRIHLIALAVLVFGLPTIAGSPVAHASGTGRPNSPRAAGPDAAPYTPLPDSWTQVGPVLPPAGSLESDRPGMAYDGSRILLFTNDDTWAWIGSLWTPLCGATVAGVAACGPPPRELESVAYDATRGQLVLVGGVTDHDFGDTWIFNGSTWSAACGTTTPVTPPCALGARYNAAMAYDPISKRIILFGGWSESAVGVGADTWAWDGSAGTALCGASGGPSCGPAASQGAALAYDPASQKLILFGGDGSNDTWSFDGSTNSWSQLRPQTSPSSRSDAGFSSDGQHLLLFGGDGACGSFCSDTWLWNGTTGNWGQLTPAANPPGRYSATLAYDASHQQVVLFGGCVASGGFNECADWRDDTWLWNGTTWSEPAQTISPGPRDTEIAYDAQHQQVVLFGGGEQTVAGLSTFADTWTWDGSSWTPRCGTTAPATPACGPPVRDSGSLAYDPALNETVLFGGSASGPSGGSALDDMWAWTGSAWTPICGTTAPVTSACGPPARALASMAYDGKQVMLFGGQDAAGNPLGDTWTWNGSTWTAICGTSVSGATAACGPPPRSGASMALDAGRGQDVLYGGAAQNTNNAGTLLADTWLWNGSAWSEACSTCGPGPRATAAMTYDAVARDVVLFGGATLVGTVGEFLNDTWTWDGNAWTQRCMSSPCDSLLPPLRVVPSLAFDTAQGGSVLFGGYGATCCLPQSLSDTWVWTGNGCRLGDVNCNGTIDATDALCVLRLVAVLPSTAACPVPEPNPQKIATDGKSTLDATDALCILRGVAHLPGTSACPQITAP